MTSQRLAETAAAILAAHKGIDIETIDVSERTSLADYFVIASGTSQIHVKALVDYVEEELGEAGVHPRSVEGADARRWVLLDYGDVVVHILHPEEREYYDLEKLWLHGWSRG
ncbi:MAG: ribosome silencing factor [Bacillota bacterium]|nr:ribosome silencing factor [Bacillota bacterium]